MPSACVAYYVCNCWLTLAMPMQKIISEKLKHAGGKTFWEVKPSETEDIGGVRYLRLPCQGVQHGFARLCLEDPVQQRELLWTRSGA